MNILFKDLTKEQLEELANQYDESFDKLRELLKMPTRLQALPKNQTKIYQEARKGFLKEANKIYAVKKKVISLLG